MSAVAGRKPIQIGGLTDDELVQLARSGDEDAFDAIVHRYRSPLVSYCRRWLDPHRAEEIVQHTLMKAFLCLRDDDRPLVLRPWLYRVAHNAALNAIEKKGSDWEELDENYDGVPQPPQVAEKRARFLKVVSEIEALPDRQREALVLNEFEGRCYAEIAEELGTSESGVRGLLRRARRQLRETAAAAFLPFPALRELFRSDSARSLNVERASELVGTAGGGVGVGAAGGFAKVAAGVLAAGTIATGGTALEHKNGAWSDPKDEANIPAAVAEPAGEPGRSASKPVAGGTGSSGERTTIRHLGVTVGGLVPSPRLRFELDEHKQEASTEKLVNRTATSQQEQPAAVAPEESIGVIGLPTGSEEEPEQETVSGEVKTEPEKSESSPNSGSSPGTQEPSSGTSPGGGGTTSSPDGGESESVPTPTIQPIRS